MVCLEARDQMPALPEEIEEALDDGVQVKNGWGPASIEVDASGHVNGVTFKRCTRVFDAAGKFAPEYDDEDTRFVACENVVLAIGQAVDWGELLEGSAVKLGRAGVAVADARTYQTDEPDIFVGGDAFTGPTFVIDAIAAGHEAAVSLHRYVQTGSSLTIGRNQRHYVELDKQSVVLNPVGYDHAGRQVPECKKAASIVHNWDEMRKTFTEDQVKAETARCLGCGASVVDPNKCIGCGLCTTRCEFDAIHLHRDNPECSTMVRSEDKLAVVLPSAGRMVLKKLASQARKMVV
jgi:NADPH-dependent glutamate synthase beta subunit-like oxidoreductase